MAATIRVEPVREGEYRVTVEEGGERTSHQVTLSPDYHKKLAAARAPEELIRRSFEFLLEREPKESILARFDLPVIARYFPEYEREIGRWLRK